ncbi:MAG: DNA-binding protein [Candidatus Poseidoniaceae archaeon]|jgi:programmed cell death protein 5|nr:DNA-binding protein [Candidatus Poseidoniaceae archaeon]
MSISGDDELANIRAQRMAQLQSQMEEQVAAQADAEIEAQAEAQAIAALDNAMKLILTPEARSRLANLNMVNNELATRVKSHLAKLSGDNRIATPVGDMQLKRILSGLQENRRETNIRRI